MRLIPATRYFTCGSCGSHILFIFNKPFQLKARGAKPRIMACLHNYWSGKASSSFTINFNYFLQLTEETKFLNILSKLVTRKFIEKYCQNFVWHCDKDHRDTVLMVKIIFLLIIYEVQLTDLESHCQTNENFRKFLNLASDLPVPDLAVIRSSGMAMGIGGFQDLLTNLMLRVRQRYHEIESNQPPKPDAGQLRNGDGRRSKAIRLAPRVAGGKSGQVQKVLVTVRTTRPGEVREGRSPLETASQPSGLEQPREVE
jgi:hypothetical protein